jgi:hypothetical protein
MVVGLRFCPLCMIYKAVEPSHIRIDIKFIPWLSGIVPLRLLSGIHSAYP